MKPYSHFLVLLGWWAGFPFMDAWGVPCDRSLSTAASDEVLPLAFTAASPLEFSKALDSYANPLFLKARSAHELDLILKNGGELYLNAAANVGFGLTKDRELISLFNGSGFPGWGAMALKVAKSLGLRYLHCLEPLKTYYEAHGFVVVARFAVAEMEPERARLWTARGRPIPERLRMEIRTP